MVKCSERSHEHVVGDILWLCCVKEDLFDHTSVLARCEVYFIRNIVQLLVDKTFDDFLIISVDLF